FAAVLMYPMAWLPFPVVGDLMLQASLASLAVTTVWLATLVADRHGWPRWFVVALALPLVTTLEPSRETIAFGLFNLLLAAFVLVGGYGLWRATKAARAGDGLAGVTLTGIVGLLVSPVSWQHHLYWFVPAILVLVDAAASGGRWRWGYGFLAGFVWFTVTIGV